MYLTCVYESPLGPLTITDWDGFLRGIHFGPAPWPEAEAEPGSTPLLRETVGQLAAYFGGALQSFDLPLRPQGTPFQQRVWAALTRIPYGETCTYGELAAMAGNPRAARAVGMANHRNPIAIVVPCHRCIGANGALVGYGAGLKKKAALLRLEHIPF